jgi:voltage-gated potassium channel
MARATTPSTTRHPLLEGAQADAHARRAAARTLVHSAFVGLLTLVAYCVLPLDGMTRATGLTLVLGLSLILVVLVWNVRSIVVSPYPRVRAAAALTTTVPLFLAVFAAAYYAMSGESPGSFSEPLTRVSSAYFTITVFSTVGFGDITPVTSGARIATSVQMIGDVILLGVGARIILGAARRGISRKESAESGASHEEKPS